MGSLVAGAWVDGSVRAQGTIASAPCRSKQGGFGRQVHVVRQVLLDPDATMAPYLSHAAQAADSCGPQDSFNSIPFSV